MREAESPDDWTEITVPVPWGIVAGELLQRSVAIFRDLFIYVSSPLDITQRDLHVLGHSQWSNPEVGWSTGLKSSKMRLHLNFRD